MELQKGLIDNFYFHTPQVTNRGESQALVQRPMFSDCLFFKQTHVEGLTWHIDM
jgi:hypothetical protein